MSAILYLANRLQDFPIWVVWNTITTGYVNDLIAGTTEAEYNMKPNPKYLNKKYYNPQYHFYAEEGQDVLRLYSERDNSLAEKDSTDVLDSIYQIVTNFTYSGCLTLMVL